MASIGINWAEVWSPVWGAVWTQTPPSPTPTPSPVGPSPSGGGGGIDYQRIRRNHRRPGRELKSLLDESLPEVYAELVAGPREVVAAVQEIVAPFRGADRTVDWAALESRADAVGRLLALVGRQRSADRDRAQREALQRSDEEWFLMN